MEQENYFLKSLRDQQNREIIDLNKKIEATEQEKTRSIENINLKYTYDTEKLRKQVEDLKKQLA
jgi:hypothetical protein